MPHGNEEANVQWSVIAIGRSSERTMDLRQRYPSATPEPNSRRHRSAGVFGYRRVVTEHELRVIGVLDGCEDDGSAGMVCSPRSSRCIQALEESARSRSHPYAPELAHERRFPCGRGDVLLVLEGAIAAPPSESAEQLSGQ
jgi:hypothetical protein